MLSKIKIERYKSLYDTEIELEPLTVLIGANGSGKSNICEALFVFSKFLRICLNNRQISNVAELFNLALSNLKLDNNRSESELNIQTKLWHQELDYLNFEVNTIQENTSTFLIKFDFTHNEFVMTPNVKIPLYPLQPDVSGKEDENDVEKSRLSSISQVAKVLSKVDLSNLLNVDSINWKSEWKQDMKTFACILKSLKKVKIYDFSPFDLSVNSSYNGSEIGKTGIGVASALVDILHTNRQSFDELEQRFIELIPNIARISLPRGKDRGFKLELVDKYSDSPIPCNDISDGTLRILAFLTVLYQEETPSIICFEEPENGIHPWLLNKMMELLKIVSTKGITGKPVQVLITTHSPLLLNYVEPHQVRVVRLDEEGKTQVNKLPTESPRFQKALEAYDEELGELWFTDIFGGNPK